MNVIIQKILFVLAGASLALGGFMIWSPGTFGLCEVVREGYNSTWGKLQFCSENNLFATHYFADPAIKLGFAIAVIGLFLLVLPKNAFYLFIKIFSIILILVLLIIYLIPDMNIMYGAKVTVIDRTDVAVKLLYILSALAYLFSLYKIKKNK